MKRLAIGSVLAHVLMGCGAPVNDTTPIDPEIAVSDPQQLAMLANVGFLQAIDSLNLGDYAYAQRPSRLLSESSCPDTPGTDKPGTALLQKTKATQHVQDRRGAWTSQSKLSLERSYEDVWYQGSRVLDCKKEKIDFTKLDDTSSGQTVFGGNSLRLVSALTEVFRRDLSLRKDSTSDPLGQILDAERKGTRDIEFSGISQSKDKFTLQASVRADLNTLLKMGTESENPQTLSIRQSRDERLDFTVDIDKNSRNWTSYSIPSGRQTFLLPSDVSMVYEFSHLTFTREGGCVPQSGTITLSSRKGSDIVKKLTYEVDPDSEMILADESEGILLAPFACVLKER